MDTSDSAALQIVLDTRQAERMRIAFERGLHQLGPAADRAGAMASRGLNRITPSLMGIRTQLGLLIGGAGIGLLGKEFVDAGRQMQGFQIGLTSVAGSAEIAANELGFLRQEADRLGQNFQKSVNAYVKLTAASKGTELQGTATREIFLGISEAATVLNMRAEQVELSLKAVEQMISKGVVSSEELRLQLGDHLPGAFNLAAQAMGKSTAEFKAMLDAGQVFSKDFIPAFAQTLRTQFAGGVEQASQSATAAINRFANTWFELKVAVAESGLLEAVTTVASGVTTLVKQLDEAVKGMGDSQTAMDAWRFSGHLVVEVFRQLVIRSAEATTGFLIMGKAADAAWRSIKKIAEGIIPQAKGSFSSAMDINKDVLDFMMHGQHSRMMPAGSKETPELLAARGSPTKSIEFLMKSNLEFAQKYTAFQQKRDQLVENVIGDEGTGAEIKDIWTDARKEMEAYVAGLEKFSGKMENPNFTPAPKPKFGPGGPPLIPDGAPGGGIIVPSAVDEARDRIRKLTGQMRADMASGTAAMRAQSLAWLTETLDQLDELQKKSGLTAEQMEEAFGMVYKNFQKQNELIPDSFRKAFQGVVAEFESFTDRFASLGGDLANSLDKNITDGLMNIITGAKDAKEAIVLMFRAIGEEMIRAAIQKLFVQQIIGALGAGLGTGHTGGVVGMNIPRMHAGGVVGDEMPILARRGEVVFTPEQMSALGKVIASNQKEGGKRVEILNVFDEKVIDQYIAANPDVIVNAMHRRAGAIRKIINS